MAERDTRSEAEIRAAIAMEREAIDKTLAELRGEITAQNGLRQNLPALAAGAFAFGFTLSGGIGAAARTVLRMHYTRRSQGDRKLVVRVQSR